MLATYIQSPRLAASGEGEGNSLYQITEIVKETYLYLDLEYHKSSVLVRKFLDGTVLIVSSPFENQGAERLMNWVKVKLQPKKIVAINTHFHMDGTGGNNVYKKHGVEIWAGDITLDWQRRMGEKHRRAAASSFEGDKARRVLETANVLASKVFKTQRGKEFLFGGTKVKVMYPGHAHSPDNVVVFFPDQKLLFGGCMIKPGKSLGYLGEGDVTRWKQSAQFLKSLNPKIVVSGHHGWGGSEYIEKTLENVNRALNKTAMAPLFNASQKTRSR